MYSSDLNGRVQPVGSAHQFDRVTFQCLQEDVLELSRLTESGQASMTPQLTAMTRNHTATIRSHHSSDERNGTQAPIGFSTDHAMPALETHDCAVGTCFRPFPPLLVEAAIQRWTWGSGGSEGALERHQAALTLSDLYIAQLVQLLHNLRFGMSHSNSTGGGGGKDLFSQSFLLEIDEVMRSAIWRGDAKGKKAAGETLGIDVDELNVIPSHSPTESPTLQSRPSYDRPSTITATSSSSTSSSSSSTTSTNISLDRRNRRASQETIHHPFAPSAYESTSDGSQSARFVGGGRGLSRRILSTTSALQRPRQCLVASILALVRFTNGLGVRLKYWRGQLKAKQSEIARLTTLAEAAKAKSQTDSTPTDDAASAKEILTLRTKVDQLEAQLSTALNTLSEYESSGRQRVKPDFGDINVTWGKYQHSDSDGPLAGEVASLRLQLEEARQENLTLIRESNERIAEHTARHDTLNTLVDSLRNEIAALKSESRTREDALTAVQSLADERELKIQQLTSMLNAIKDRVASREKEWEAKEQQWKNGSKSPSSGSNEDDAAAAARAAHAAKEAEWFAMQQQRDEMEASLSAACQRAKQAHAAVLREYEDLRRENQRTAEEVDRERKEMADRLKKCNHQLSEARATITSLKAQIKKLTDQLAQLTAQSQLPPEPSPPSQPPAAKLKDPLKEERARQKKEAARRAEEEAEAAMIAAEEAERQRASDQAAKAAEAAAERIKLAAAKLKKEKAQRKKEAEALLAAQAAAQAQLEQQQQQQQQQQQDDKLKRSKKKREPPSNELKENQPPKMAPPTALELSKPTPKLSSGYGRCIYEEGEWYEGWWVDYERSGEGTYQWRDGRRYVGNWLKDKKHGEGKYYWVDGDRYEGEYSNDKMHGYGTYYFSDGTRYEGEWFCDMSHGKGQFLYSDGAKYVGHFDRDQKHGTGMMHLPSGELFSEHWVNGKRISSVSVKQTQPQQQPQQTIPPPSFSLQPHPPESSSTKLISRNIRLAAQEQLAMSARGAGPPNGRR